MILMTHFYINIFEVLVIANNKQIATPLIETPFVTNSFIYTFRLITGEFKLFNIVYFMIH